METTLQNRVHFFYINGYAWSELFTVPETLHVYCICYHYLEGQWRISSFFTGCSVRRITFYADEIISGVRPSLSCLPKNPSPRRNSSEHLSQNKCFFYHSTCLLSVKEKSEEVFFGVRTEKSVMWFDGFIAGWRRMLWCYTDKDYVIVWWEARNSERSWRLLRQKNSGRVLFRMRGILRRAFSCSL